MICLINSESIDSGCFGIISQSIVAVSTANRRYIVYDGGQNKWTSRRWVGEENEAHKDRDKLHFARFDGALQLAERRDRLLEGSNNNSYDNDGKGLGLAIHRDDVVFPRRLFALINYPLNGIRLSLIE